MTKTYYVLHSFFLLVLTIYNTILGRSPLRPPEKNLPEIRVYTSNNAKTYMLKDSHLEEYPLFVFDKKHFFDNILPTQKITYINNEHFSPKYVTGGVNGTHLAQLAQTALDEVKQKKKHFTHFHVLQTKNFNRKHQCGLLVLEYKDYPFVLKLFVEHAHTFVDYHCKGIEPIVFFYMNHCPSTRHTAGLTRIKNRTAVLNKLAQHPYWSKQSIIIPRKWFWLPQKEPWLQVTGKNIGSKKQLKTTLPAVYGIIADKMDMKTNRHALQLREKKKIAMQLCNDLYLLIDPHITNYHFVHNKDKTRIGITICDTEHFPSIVGLKEPKQCKSHSAWYLFLAGKCTNDMLFRTKNRRITAQTEQHKMMI